MHFPAIDTLDGLFTSFPTLARASGSRPGRSEGERRAALVRRKRTTDRQHRDELLIGCLFDDSQGDLKEFEINCRKKRRSLERNEQSKEENQGPPEAMSNRCLIRSRHWKQRSPLRYIFRPRIAKRFMTVRCKLCGSQFSCDGEFFAVTGSSGCGKALLQMLGALDRPTKGTLLYRGNSIPICMINRVCARDWFFFRRFCCQLFGLETQIRCLKITFPFGRRERAVTFRSVGPGNRLSIFLSKLSGGERQRVAIARSLVSPPFSRGRTDRQSRQRKRQLVLELIIRLLRTG